MKLAAVVVLYHPDENLVRNINSYLPQVDTLVLWDNTPEGEKSAPLSLSGVCHPERLEYMGCGRNVSGWKFPFLEPLGRVERKIQG